MKPELRQEEQNFFDSPTHRHIAGSLNTQRVKIDTMTHVPGTPMALWTVIIIIH